MHSRFFELSSTLPRDTTYLLYAPSSKTIKDLRGFLLGCLARDYGFVGLSLGSCYWLPGWKLNRHFGRLFCILTRHERYRKHKRWDDWQLYFDHHFNRAADAIGVPRTLAQQMLCCFQWRSAQETCDQFLAYRTYAHGVPDVAEKLYFDREVVIDAVIEDADVRRLVKSRVKVIQKTWFKRLDGPRLGKEYEMTAWAAWQDVDARKYWKPVAVRPVTSHIPYWSRDSSYRFSEKVRLRNFSIHDEALRTNWLSQRPRPGAPRDFWPPQFLEFVPPEPPKYSDALKGKSKEKRVVGRRKANVLIYVGRLFGYSKEFY